MCPCLFLVGQHQFKILAEKWDSVEARIFFGFELLAVPWRKVGDWWRMLGAPSGETAMEISHAGLCTMACLQKCVDDACQKVVLRDGLKPSTQDDAVEVWTVKGSGDICLWDRRHIEIPKSHLFFGGIQHAVSSIEDHRTAGMTIPDH